MPSFYPRLCPQTCWYHNQALNMVLQCRSYRESVHHYLAISLDLMQLSLHIKPCGCRRTFPQEGIRVQAGRDCQVVPGKHWPLRFQMIPECHRALTGMPPFVVAMKEGRYGLWRPRVDDDCRSTGTYIQRPWLHSFLTYHTHTYTDYIHTGRTTATNGASAFHRLHTKNIQARYTNLIDVLRKTIGHRPGFHEQTIVLVGRFRKAHSVRLFAYGFAIRDDRVGDLQRDAGMILLEVL